MVSKNNNEYICKYCGKKFDSFHKLGGHIIWCKNNPNHDECLQKLEKARKNIDHSKINKLQICYCKYCNKECKSINSLKQHECRCKENPNRIDLTYLSNRDHSRMNLNPSNQFIKAKQEGRSIIITDETRYKLGKGNRGKIKSDEERKKISDYMKEAVKNHPESYYGVNTNKRVKKYLYKNIWLDGSWELLFAQYLDKLNIKWERPRNGIEYIWNNEIHLYYPDFYLTDYNLYVEIKGQETLRDQAKWKMVENLLVLKLNEIKQIIRNTYNIFDHIQ